MKIRCGISLVIGLAMLILALPYLSFEGNMEETIFSFAWLALAFSVLGGNLSAILYSMVINEQSHRQKVQKIPIFPDNIKGHID